MIRLVLFLPMRIFKIAVTIFLITYNLRKSKKELKIFKATQDLCHILMQIMETERKVYNLKMDYMKLEK